VRRRERERERERKKWRRCGKRRRMTTDGQRVGLMMCE